MEIVKPTVKLTRMCDVTKCNYYGPDVYFLMQLTKEDCKHLKLKEMIGKARFDEVVHTLQGSQFCIHFVQICSMHLHKLLKQHPDYILWCSI